MNLFTSPQLLVHRALSCPFIANLCAVSAPPTPHPTPCSNPQLQPCILSGAEGQLDRLPCAAARGFRSERLPFHPKCVFVEAAAAAGSGGITRLVFLLAKRAHLFCRRSQWEAVLLISLGQTLACVKCLQNQHWQQPRALVDICVCSSENVYSLSQTLLYHFKLCVDGFFCTCCRKNECTG